MGNNCPFMNRYRYNRTFHGGFTRDSWSVAILLQNRLPFVHAQTWIDSLGRYIAVLGTLKGVPTLIVSVYASPTLSPSLLDSLGHLISQLSEGHLMIG